MSSPLTVDVLCCLCGSKDHKLLYLGKDRLLRHAGTFPIVQCCQCGMVYQSPRPRDMNPYYEGDYMCYDGRPIRFNPILKRKRRFSPDPDVEFYGSARAYCEIVHSVTQNLPVGRRLLDVGCGSGDFLAAAEALGWDVYGIEPSIRAAERANERLRDPERSVVKAGFLSADTYETCSFDLVTLWHVIEHLDNPVETMRYVAHVLKPGGFCIIQTPRWGSLESRLFGRFWSGLDSPRHLWIFSDATMSALMQQVGLSGHSWPSSNSYPLYALSTKFWRGQGSTQKGDKAFEFMHKPIVDKLGAALTWASLDRTRWASNLTIVVQKPQKTGQ